MYFYLFIFCFTPKIGPVYNNTVTAAVYYTKSYTFCHFSKFQLEWTTIDCYETLCTRVILILPVEI